MAGRARIDGRTTVGINERVELNAMTSDALIEMVEGKLKNYG